MSVQRFNRQRDGNVQLSPNFRVIEFASRDGFDQILIDTRLVQVLQRIRNWVGRPVNVNSGFRSPAHNTAVGGAVRSLHLEGKAADITVSGVSPIDIARWAESALREEGLVGGIIVYNTFTHIDTRTVRYRAVNNNGRVTVNNGWTPMVIPNIPDTTLPPFQTIPIGDNVQFTIGFFLPKGFSNAATAAIVGNLQQESGVNINPAAEQRNGPGRGAIQWEGDRLVALLAAARQQGVEWQNLEFQLNFMWSEMQSRDINDRMRGRATTWNDGGAFQKALDRKGAVAVPNGIQDFMRMTDVETATRLLEATYFRAGTPRMERRIEFAHNIFNTLQNNTQQEEGPISENFNVKITGTSVNIRLGPGTNYPVIGQIKINGIYTVMAKANGQGSTRGWGMIIVGVNGAQSGWIALDHVERLR